MWKEWEEMPQEFKDHLFTKKCLVGKWHYHYENENGTIGLIQIQVPSFSTTDIFDCDYQWEACGLLEYERFSSQEEAEIAIYKALKEKMIVT